MLGGTEVKFLFILIGLAFLLPSDPALARSQVVARIDISSQTMSVYVHGRRRYTFPVSTGKRGFRTPTGSYSPKRLHRMWYSRKYQMTPMPYSIFFKGGYAIHATNQVRRLGRPASHGCIRLSKRNAKTLYSLVKQYGMYQTRIIIQR